MPVKKFPERFNQGGKTPPNGGGIISGWGPCPEEEGDAI